MLSYSTVLPLAAIFSMASGHGVILAAQGEAGSPASIGFLVNDALARNCTSISPCQLDTTIIRDAEITANIVNECGRTQLAGNIDVGEQTENALAAGTVTQVKAGGTMTVTIHQVNADGAGPYSCDLDETSNTGKISQNLTVTNNVPGANGLSQAKTQDFNITVAMPAKLACTGGSTGNVCTVRCRNNALAGPFGGCVAVQQADAVAAKNTPSNIQTAQKQAAIDAQIKSNKADLKAAVTANQIDGSDAQSSVVKSNAALLNETPVTIKASPAEDIIVDDAAASASGANNTATAGTGGKKAKGNKGAAGNTAAAGATTANAKGNKNAAGAAAGATTANAATAKANKNNNARHLFGRFVRAGEDFVAGQ